jgi:hypothetical protein
MANSIACSRCSGRAHKTPRGYYLCSACMVRFDEIGRPFACRICGEDVSASRGNSTCPNCRAEIGETLGGTPRVPASDDVPSNVDSSQDAKVGLSPPPLPEGEWYFARGGRVYGPITLPVLHRLFEIDDLLYSDLVWRQGMPEWVAADGFLDEAIKPNASRVLLKTKGLAPNREDPNAADAESHQPAVSDPPSSPPFWYYAVVTPDGSRLSEPSTLEELRQRAASGALHPNDLVMIRGGDWVPAKSVEGLVFGQRSSTPAPRAPVSSERMIGNLGASTARPEDMSTDVQDDRRRAIEFFEKSLKALKNHIPDLLSAIDHIEQAVRYAPRDKSILRARAEAYRASGTSSPLQAIFYNEEGNKLSEEGSFQEAYRMYIWAAQCDPLMKWPVHYDEPPDPSQPSIVQYRSALSRLNEYPREIIFNGPPYRTEDAEEDGPVVLDPPDPKIREFGHCSACGGPLSGEGFCKNRKCKHI